MAPASKKASKQEATSLPNSLQFNEHNPFWMSSLFNEVYVRNDVPLLYGKMWDGDKEFEDFHNGFHNFVLEQSVERANTWSESDTITNWIVPIMELLGWHDRCEGRQTPYIEELSLSLPEGGSNKTFRLDLAYLDEPKLKQYIKGETNPESRLREARNEHTGVQMVVEAKYWDRLEHYRQNIKEDQRRSIAKSADTERALSPDDQIIKYLDILQRDFGILTDGKTWRIYHRELSVGDVRRYFEFDVGNLADLVSGGLDNRERRDEYLGQARYFFYFFRKSAFVQKGAALPFVYEVLEYSKKYASSVEEDLKRRFIQAMGVICNAFSSQASTEQEDIELIRNAAESHLFNILFIRSCESRKILPLHATDYLRISLTEIIESMDHMRFDPDKDLSVFDKYFKIGFGNDFKLSGYEIYDRLIKLYQVVHEGGAGFGVRGFQETLFEKREWAFAVKYRIDNRSMLLCLFYLNFTESSYKARKYQQIPYNIFTPRQLGSIYESFLEFRLEKANDDLLFVKGQWKKANFASTAAKKAIAEGCATVKRGELFFTPDNKERKLTGAYYTPDYVVRHIVETVLTPLLSGKASKDILKLRICDLAMGSAHFLNEGLQFLTRRYREACAREFDEVSETFNVTARKILDTCIYGIDINSRAVKLAKLSLWLSTANINEKLERLDDQLKCLDSLVTGSEGIVKEFGCNFDAVIGNPPYGGHLPEDTKPLLKRTFETYSLRGESYVLFAELAISVLKRGGFVGFIMPDTFLNLGFTAPLRTFFLQNVSLQQVVVMPRSVFKDATVDTLIVVGKKMDRTLDFHPSTVEVIQLSKTHSSAEFSGGKRIFVESGQWHTSGVFSIALDGNTSDIVYKMERHSKLETFAEMYSGIKCYEVGKGTPPQTEKILKEKPFTSATRLSKDFSPFFDGKHIGRYELLWEKNNWIRYGKWLAAPRDSKVFKGEKILIRKIVSDTLIGTYIEEDSYCNTLLFVVKLREKVVSYHALLGILNSKLIGWYFRNKLSINPDDTFPQIMIRDILSFPIPKLAIEVERSLEKNVKKMLTNDSSSKQFRLSSEEIDNLVFQAYGLTKAEQAEIESGLTNAEPTVA